MSKKQSATPEKRLADLEAVVREYISEMSNPSPDAVIRGILRDKLATMVGVESPTAFLRRWREGSKRA